MIIKITGKITYQFPTTFIIEVNNIGYEVEPAFQDVRINEEVTIYTHEILREDKISMYGFKDIQQLELFKELLTVSGVGPKTAALLIREHGFESLINSIALDDVSGLKVKGLGKKTGQKIILELKDKITSEKWSKYISKESDSPDGTNLTLRLELKAALIDLGYNESEITKYINTVELNKTDDLSLLIKQALNDLR